MKTSIAKKIAEYKFQEHLKIVYATPAGKTHLGALIINKLKYKFRFKKLKN